MANRARTVPDHDCPVCGHGNGWLARQERHRSHRFVLVVHMAHGRYFFRNFSGVRRPGRPLYRRRKAGSGKGRGAAIRACNPHFWCARNAHHAISFSAPASLARCGRCNPRGCFRLHLHHKRGLPVQPFHQCVFQHPALRGRYAHAAGLQHCHQRDQRCAQHPPYFPHAHRSGAGPALYNVGRRVGRKRRRCRHRDCNGIFGRYAAHGAVPPDLPGFHPAERQVPL